VLEKPLGAEPEAEWGRRLAAAVRMASRIRVITHPRAKLGATAARRLERETVPRGRRGIVAIGASTGGPGAILEIMRALPQDFGSPIALVIHIDEPFGRALADWLDAQTPLRVAYPEDGVPIADLPPGSVSMAAPGRHLVLSDGRLRFSDAAPLHSCRPSVDALFHSIAADAGAAAVGCLLTGMGRDGAAGLLAMRQAGAATIAQDEQTSVVFGMPGEAVKLGAAERVMPLGAIAGALTALAGGAT
jgi:two-component system chemotaxis response regulator CheB